MSFLRFFTLSVSIVPFVLVAQPAPQPQPGTPPVAAGTTPPPGGANIPSLNKPITLAEVMERLSKIEPGHNPFAPVVNSSDNGNVEGVYSVLSTIAGPLYGANGTGSVSFEGSPWSTGDFRFIQVGHTHIKVTFVSITPPTTELPGNAIMRVGDDKLQQEYSIPLGTVLPNTSQITQLAGWLILSNYVLIPARIEGKVEFAYQGRHIDGHSIAYSTTSGFSLVRLDKAVASSLTASLAIPERVIIYPLQGKAYSVPSTVLSSPLGKHTELFGAIVLSSRGEFVGVLGHQGLIAPKDIGLPVESAPNPTLVDDPRARLVFTAGDTPAQAPAPFVNR